MHAGKKYFPPLTEPKEEVDDLAHHIGGERLIKRIKQIGKVLFIPSIKRKANLYYTNKMYVLRPNKITVLPLNPFEYLSYAPRRLTVCFPRKP